MFNNLFKHKILSENQTVNIIGLNNKAQANYVWDLFCVSKTNLLIITNTLYEANNLYKSLSYYDINKILFFPMDDFLVSEALAISPDLMSKRIETLNELVNSKENKIIITNLTGYLRFLPTKTLWKKSRVIVNKDISISRNELLRRLDIMGYEKNSLVTKTGEYANRGYILDIFPYGEEKPFRIEFFDDEIEEIREFDASTQLSISKKDEIIILPFTEFINENQKLDIPKRQSLLPRVVDKVSSISEYMEDSITIFSDLEAIKISYEKLLEQMIEYKETDQFNIEKYVHDLYDIVPHKYLNISTTDNYDVKGSCEIYKTIEIDKFNGNFSLIDKFLSSCLKSNRRVIVCLDNEKMIEDFSQRISLEYNVTTIHNIRENTINIVNHKMNNGFIINNDVYITSNEIYKRNTVINYHSKFRYGTKIRDINKLQIGDYVVHSSFGIGKYLGIVTLPPKGLKKDYIHLQYKVYVH